MIAFFETCGSYHTEMAEILTHIGTIDIKNRTHEGIWS